MSQARWFMGVIAVVALLLSPVSTLAQEQEGPGMRVMTVVTFEVPFQDRDVVMPFIRDYLLPDSQLNPNILNFRVLMHLWGSNASEILLISEYATFADIEAPCGQPCDDYRAANPEPEEGSEGYEDFVRARDLFTQYFSAHRDEIYNVPMNFSRVEGEITGRVGPPPPPPPPPGGIR